MERYWPEDVLYEVLYRLPGRCILLFKTFSRWLYTEIKTSFFLHQHLRLNMNHSLLVDQGKDRTGYSQISILSVENSVIVENRRLQMLQGCEPKFQYATEFLKTCRVVGVCNGIVCIEDGITSDYLVLWNPLTAESRLLPTQSYKEEKSLFSTSAVGFGYDDTNADLKVLVMQRNRDAAYDVVLVAEVYSCHTDCWRRLNNVPKNKDIGNPWGGICLGSKYFWLPQNTEMIMYFDFTDESFHSISLPSPLLSGVHLTDYEGEIAVVNHDPLEDNTHIYIGLEGGAVWDKRVQIENLRHDERVIGFWRKSLVFVSRGGERVRVRAVRLLNFSTRESSMFPITGRHVFNYKESLLTVKRADRPSSSS